MRHFEEVSGSSDRVFKGFLPSLVSRVVWCHTSGDTDAVPSAMYGEPIPTLVSTIPHDALAYPPIGTQASATSGATGVDEYGRVHSVYTFFTDRVSSPGGLRVWQLTSVRDDGITARYLGSFYRSPLGRRRVNEKLALTAFANDFALRDC